MSISANSAPLSLNLFPDASYPNVEKPKINIGPFHLQKAGVVSNLQYVETYAKEENLSEEVHLYKNLSHPNECDREGGELMNYLDIWECQEYPDWAEATQRDERKFYYLGPLLIKVAEKIVKEKLKWTTLTSENIFSVEGVYNKFYADVFTKQLPEINDGIGYKIMEIVNKHLIAHNYNVDWAAGEIRLFYDNRSPVRADLDHFKSDTLLQKITLPLKYAGSELFTLYNRERAEKGRPKILASQKSQELSKKIIQARHEKVEQEKKSAVIDKLENMIKWHHRKNESPYQGKAKNIKFKQNENLDYSPSLAITRENSEGASASNLSSSGINFLHTPLHSLENTPTTSNRTTSISDSLPASLFSSPTILQNLNSSLANSSSLTIKPQNNPKDH